MASYTIHSNALSGEYIDKYTGQIVQFTNETFHPGSLQGGISRFKVTFTNDIGGSITQEHEVESTDSLEIDNQLKITLTEYNNRNGHYTEPDITPDQTITL